MRLDEFGTSIPAQNKPAGQFGPPWVQRPRGNANHLHRHARKAFARVDTGSWWASRRASASNWDVFGNGKTVIKGSFGRYNWTPGDDFGSPFNPNTTSVSTYKWSGAGCTEALALAGGCDYVPGTVNLNPNGGGTSSRFSAAATARP